MEQILSTAQNFIVLYYNFAATCKNDINKFYDQNALVWRSGSSKAIKLSEINERLFPEVKHGSEFNVVDYSVVPVEENKAFNLTVTGNFSYNKENIQAFTQCFTLKYFDEKAAIISDSLFITPVDSIVVPEKELVECPPYERKQMRARQNKQKEQKEQKEKKEHDQKEMVEKPQRKPRYNDNDRFKPYVAPK